MNDVTLTHEDLRTLISAVAIASITKGGADKTKEYEDVLEKLYQIAEME